MLSLKDKIAIVTGCGTLGEGWGNGKAIAALFARQGAMVYGVDRDAEAARQTQAAIEAEGGRCHVGTCDVTDPLQVANLVADCVARFGRLDVLVNNVGRSEPGDAVTTSEEAWAEQFDVNVNSAFRMCRAAIPTMEERGGGAIVNISSIAALRYGGKPQIAYSASKAALIQFTRMAAVMHAPQGVRLNCVIPGLINTPLVRRMADKYAGGDYEGFVAKRNAQVPMGHMGDAWDVAHAALFLASDEAKYVTATEILVDGGVTATMQ